MLCAMLANSMIREYIYLSITAQLNNMLNVGREIRPISRYPHGDFIAKYSRPL